VLQPGADAVDVWLPAGRWRHAVTNETLVGEDALRRVPAPLGTPAAFWFEGAQQQQQPQVWNTSYATNFSAFDASLWALALGCEHCGAGSGECTQMWPNSTTFGAINGVGMVHTTRRIPPAFSPCGSPVTSGHAAFNAPFLFGNFTVTARWFPGAQANVQSATGFIGLDGPNNVASITQGFHGKGCPKGTEGEFAYQHGVYADVAKSHHQQDINVSRSLAEDFNTFGLLWEPSRVVWSFNGAPMATFEKASDIPQVPLFLRLDSRAGWQSLMPADASFTAAFTLFEYTPLHMMASY
jgi:hypothetical protein